MGLHQFGTEHSALVWWPAGEVFQPHTHYGGEEIFVLGGEFIDEHGRYPKGSWLRSPHASRHHPFVEQDTLIWVKTGHL
jgi:anti-sigma factor ChrR (cupin superfamily)